MDLVPTWLAAGVKRPLLAAACNEWWSVCCQLLHDGCHAERADLRFALVRAAAAGQSQAVSSLIDAGACTIAVGSEALDVQQTISTAFTIAASQGLVGACRAMVDKQVVKEQSLRQSVLSSAADKKGAEPVLELLLEAGCNANGGQGHFDAYASPLGKAISKDNIKAAQLLLRTRC
jgi:hypothetical protein